MSPDPSQTRTARTELADIFQENPFATPKPKRLIQKIVDLATNEDSIIIDSFAGSATTAQAVLEANERDNGNRRFVLIEMEDYADKVTAERARRIMKGYEYQGTEKTELLRETLNWRRLSDSTNLIQKVSAIENLEGHRFDRITKTVKDSDLIVVGEKTITERVEGLGGSFTFCTLGEPVELDKVLTGDELPSFAALGAVLFHMATNRSFDPGEMDEDGYYLGETEGQHLWLIYRNNLDWLKSPQAALTLQRAKEFAIAKPGKKHLVFAPARFVSQKMLAEQNIPVEFVPLPFALYRIERT
jgi:adenine-specific DNA-methyltransferase